MLKLADGLKLPVDAITQTFGVLAMRGAGKSNLAAVMAEEMFEAGLPFVVVDPVGSWWGLRSAADGKRPGLAVPIFGGQHGDVPLEKTGGQVLADLVVDERASCVLDLSDMSEGDKIRFLCDFAERLYRRNRDPLHLFLEESDDYAPQRPFREQARLLRAWENVVRRGRARGLGITMITQRSAALAKSVLTQIETLFVLRTTSPQDRKAVQAWVDFHGTAGNEVLESLPTLRAGEAWAWSPHWLGVTKRLQVRRRWTFDSGATPKDLRARRRAATLADVDLGAIRERMAATIERAKAEDPRELKRRVAELELQLASRSTPAPTKEHRVEVPVLKEGQVKRLEAAAVRAEKIAAGLQERVHDLREEAAALRQVLRQPIPGFTRPAREIPNTGRLHKIRATPAAPADRFRSERQLERLPGKSQNPDLPGPIGGGLRRMLVALAQRPQGLSARQLGVRAGLSSRSGTFCTYLARARTSGWVAGDRGRLTLTEAGLATWLGELGGGAARMIETLASAYPRALSKQELGEASGLSSVSGTFSTYLSRLRSLELVEGRGELRASGELFEGEPS